MVKPVGGRGLKAPYETVIVRIPVNVKPQVDKLVQEFREGSSSDKLGEVNKVVTSYRLASKHTRDWSKADKLIQDLLALLEAE